MESPSDSVNGVNADAPLDKDGGEKVVGALVNDSGPIEKCQSQMAEAKHIIIPFPFGFCGNQIKGRRRKKRNPSRNMQICSLATVVVGAVTGALSVKAYTMKKNIKNGNNSDDYHDKYVDLMLLSGLLTAITVILFAVAFYNFILVIYANRNSGGQRGIQMTRV